MMIKVLFNLLQCLTNVYTNVFNLSLSQMQALPTDFLQITITIATVYLC